MFSRAHASSAVGPDGPAPLPPLAFEISAGRTRFRLRPVTSKRFLIGSGAGCDLRLGGEEIPPLHSIVYVDRVEALLETVTVNPPLKVNGLPVESVLLQNGDRISLGPFELLTHRPVENESPSPLVQLPAPQIITPGEQELRLPAASELSACELVDLIEEEQHFVERFERGRRLGAAALLEAAAQHQHGITPDNADAATAPADAAFQQPAKLAHLLRQANDLAAELKQRTIRFADREVAQAEFTDAVAESQQQLAARLESLASRIARLEQAKPLPLPKVA